MDRGRLKVLAVFDKPDPLVGPYFEESIYVTPSRLPPETQAAVMEELRRAAQALGLHHGPLHAELRINTRGTWTLEVAARSIGGRGLWGVRLPGPGKEENKPPAERIMHLALGEEGGTRRREEDAAGAREVPVPAAAGFGEAICFWRHATLDCLPLSAVCWLQLRRVG